MSRKYIKAVLNSNINIDVTKDCPISYSYSTDAFSENDMKTAVKDCLKKIKETLHVYIPKETIDKIIDGSVLLIKSDNERKKTVFADSNYPLNESICGSYAFCLVEKEENGFSTFYNIDESGLTGWTGASVFSEMVFPYSNEKELIMTAENGYYTMSLKNSVNERALAYIAKKTEKNAENANKLIQAIKNMTEAHINGHLYKEAYSCEEFNFSDCSDWLGATITDGSFSVSYVARMIK